MRLFALELVLVRLQAIYFLRKPEDGMTVDYRVYFTTCTIERLNTELSHFSNLEHIWQKILTS